LGLALTMKNLHWILLLCLAGRSLAEGEPAYVAWGGPGGQIFRHKITIVKNHPYNPRALLVIVDDLPKRGTRLGIARVTVEYKGGADVSERLLKAIHAKPYEYPMIKMYLTPQSPKMVRIVLPQATHVAATFRFYRSIHAPMGKRPDKEFQPVLTRTIAVETLEALPVLKPARDPRIRAPREGDTAPDTALVLGGPGELIKPPPAQAVATRSELEKRILAGEKLESLTQTPQEERAKARQRILEAQIQSQGYADGTVADQIVNDTHPDTTPKDTNAQTMELVGDTPPPEDALHQPVADVINNVPPEPTPPEP
jgi:hypothetical protein